MIVAGPGKTAFGPHRARAALRVLLSLACALHVACSSARAQTAPPGPAFTPGLYETESRNSAIPGPALTSKSCMPAADYAAFRDDIMEQNRKAPQFKQLCRLGDVTEIKNGFTFWMQCGGTKSTLTYEFEKELVRNTIQVVISGAPKNSQSITVLMRRVGDCPDQK
jgi:uncharacterized protein DUF3617